MSISSALSTVKTAVTSNTARSVLQVQKHSPALLFGAGVVGVVATTVMASRATLRLETVVSENERKQAEALETFELDTERYTQKDYKKDLAILKVRFCKDVVRLYGPTAAVGVLSVAALTGSHIILNRRNAGLVAAYTTLDESFNKYRERVIEKYGKDDDRRFLYGEEQTEFAVVDPVTGQAEVVTNNHFKEPSRYAKVFSRETAGTSWSDDPGYNYTFLRHQQQYATDKLRAQGHLFLNEVYDALHMERTQEGAVVGWIWNSETGDNRVDFSIFDEHSDDKYFDFMTGRDKSILLDFNVDGVIYSKI